MDVHLGEQTIQAIHAECERLLAGYIENASGDFVMPTSAHILCGTC